jgi:hypothetical protein
MRRRGTAHLLNAEAAPCRPPIIFEPPSLLVDRPELWTVTTGPRAEWGGACVAWSEDGDHYDQAAAIGADAVAGTLLDPLSTDADGQGVRLALDDEGVLASVDLAAARRLQTECYLGDGRNEYELVAFTGVTLLERAGAAHIYRLHGPLIRGAYGTAVRTWPAGTRFARLDAEVSRLPLPHRLVAARAPLQVKLVSVNAVGDLDSIDDPAAADPMAVAIAGKFYERHPRRWL